MTEQEGTQLAIALALILDGRTDDEVASALSAVIAKRGGVWALLNKLPVCIPDGWGEGNLKDIYEDSEFYKLSDKADLFAMLKEVESSMQASDFQSEHFYNTVDSLEVDWHEKGWLITSEGNKEEA